MQNEDDNEVDPGIAWALRQAEFEDPPNSKPLDRQQPPQSKSTESFPWSEMELFQSKLDKNNDFKSSFQS